MSELYRFISALLLFSAVVFIIGFILFSTVFSDYFQPVFYFLIIYFIILSAGGRFILLKGKINKPANFNMRYFMVRWGKVLLHMTFIIIYLFNHRENVLAFILTFLAYYVVFSVFDIYTLNNYLKKK